MSDLEKRVRVQLRKTGKKSLAADELSRRAGVGKSEKKEFGVLLSKMAEQGELVRQQNHKVVLARCVGAKPATIIKVKKTFGFARIDDAQQDVFVPGRQLMGTLPGDRVMVRVSRSEGELDAGEVLSVIERAKNRLSGTVVRSEYGELEFVPDNSAFVPVYLEGQEAAASEGEKVVALLVQHGDSHRDCRAVVQSRFGAAELAKNCCGAILDAAGIEREFSAGVLHEAEQAAAQPVEKEMARRLDLRGVPIFTIDGADTKDIDDAVSVKRTASGWKLGVHIADVSYYVAPKSLLDETAFSRGTSVYYADSVIPMLPPALSNGACSLNPQEDRLAFSALISLDQEGEIRKFRFEKSVIRSRVKGVYSEINRIFQGERDEALLDKYREVFDELPLLRELAGILAARRRKRGALDLSSAEAKILVDEEGRAADIKPRVQGESERLIEEMMLVANEAAATLALEKLLPFVYRVHEPPAPEKLAVLKELLDTVGIPSGAVAPGVLPKQLSALLSRAKEGPYAVAVNSAMLRAMQKARYNDKNLGHYGLALANYVHFTSPIRRYPDLAIHRILSAFCMGVRPAEISRRYASFAAAAAKRSSAAELAAMGAERACEDCYKAEYMHRHLGEVFEGMISSAAPHGIYVQLDNTVEGLVRTEALGEGMLYDGKMQYCTENGARRLRVGDRVRVQVAAATVSTGRIDFVLAEG